MAYSKKTWKARQGTGLNKFILGTVDSQGRQTITNLPDQITESGDALSADNFNDFEDRIEDGFNDVNEELESHTSNTNNPHGVTKTQIGLGNVDNTSDLNKPISNATQIALNSKANASSFESHTSNTDNPHEVTKAQIGLGNVDNTSDLDKPISTNVQNALNLKADRDIDGIAGNIAMLDSNGNSIDSNLPISEVARKDVVISNSKRIANLEDKSAPYTIDYPSDDYGKGDIPASVEKGAVVKGVDGNTRRWKQLVDPTYASTDTINGITFTNNGDGSWTVSGTASATAYIQLFADSSTTNHVFLLKGCPSGGSGLSGFTLWHNSTSSFDNGSGVIYTQSSEGGIYLRVASGTDLSTPITFRPCVYDLTLIFGAGNEPTTVAEAIAQIPALGRYNDYDAGSLVKLKVGGYKFTSRNLIAESNIELGGISPYGVPYEATSGTWWRNADFIEVKPARTYYVKLPSGYTTANANIYAYYYDEDGNFISRGVNVAGTVITTPNNCFKVKLNYYFVTATLVTPTEICLNLSDSNNGTYTAHSSQSVEFSSPVELDKAGNVKDRLDVESGVVKRNVGYGTISSDNATLEGATSTRTQFRIALPSNTIYTDSSVVPNLTVVGFETVSQNDSSSAGQAYCRIADNSYFVVFVDAGYDLETFLSEYGGTEFTYELATPTTEEISVPSAIEVEPYGTIELIQEQDIEIDTEFSVQYIPDSQYLTKSMVVDNLSSESTDVPLSANQGRILAQKIARNTKAIANIIEKEGEVSISYPDSIYGRGEVPSGMAKFAEVSCLRGVSRVGNQLIPSISTQTSGGVTFTNNGDGSYTITGTTTSAVYIFATVNGVGTHRYLMYGGVASKVGLFATYEGTSVDVTDSVFSGIYNSKNLTGIAIQIKGGIDFGTGLTIRPILTDLTLYFDGTIPSDAQTIADIQQNYPELLIPSAYDAGSLVDITYSAVESEGVNLWDEEWEVGEYSNTGTKVSGDGVRCKNMISVVPGQTYYLKGSATFWVCKYGMDGTFLSRSQYSANSVQTFGADVAYITFNTASAYGNTYLHDIQICLNSYPDKTTYHPHFKSVFTLPSPVTLRSAGSVADTDELCVEVSEGVFKRRQTVRVGRYTFTGNESWVYGSTVGHLYFRLNIASWGAKRENSSTERANVIISGYSTEGSREVYNNSIPYSDCIPYDNDIIMIYNPSITSASDFASHMAGRTMRFELADPIVTLTDPIPDNFLPTEAGGTITPKQTQSKQIDTRFDIEYLAL